MEQYLTLFIHHGGNFVEENGIMKYKWGSVDVWEDCDEDTLDVFSFKKFGISLGYHNVKSVYWLDPSLSFRDGIKILDLDVDLLDMVEVAKINGCKMDIYFEHSVNEPPDTEVLIQSGEEVGTENLETGDNVKGGGSFADIDAADGGHEPFVGGEEEGGRPVGEGLVNEAMQEADVLGRSQHAEDVEGDDGALHVDSVEGGRPVGEGLVKETMQGPVQLETTEQVEHVEGHDEYMHVEAVESGVFETVVTSHHEQRTYMTRGQIKKGTAEARDASGSEDVRKIRKRVRTEQKRAEKVKSPTRKTKSPAKVLREKETRSAAEKSSGRRTRSPGIKATEKGKRTEKQISPSKTVENIRRSSRISERFSHKESENLQTPHSKSDSNRGKEKVVQVEVGAAKKSPKKKGQQPEPMVQVQRSPYKKSNQGKEKGNQKVVDEDSGLQKADKGRGKEKVIDEGAGLQNADKGRGKEKVVHEGAGLKKPDKGRGKEKVVDEGAGVQKPDKGKGKQNVVDEDSDSWSDEIFDDSDDNFEGLGEDVSDESDFDIETMLEDRTDDSDEGLSWISEEIKTPINSDNEEMDREVNPQWNEESTFGHIQLELGMEFPTIQSFKKAVKDYTIQLGRQVTWVKNDKVRARAKCNQSSCRWEIFCSYSNALHCFQIKTFQNEHTCGRVFKNKQADQKWVIDKLVKKLRKEKNMKIGETIDYFKQRFGVHIDRTKIWRSVKRAKSIFQGSEQEQYAKLWDYCNELLKWNPGSTVKMESTPQPDDPPQFRRIYICFDGCKKGFKEGCRPLIGLDGAFLKGYYGGILLSAVGQDSNNHIWVIAYAVVDVENKENWTWFLDLLHKDLGDHVQYGWNFISDMQKGLRQAIQDVMPGAPHRFCVWHLWQNFSKHWKSRELRNLLWVCARSTEANQFNRNMNTLKVTNKHAHDYLAEKPKEAWTKAYFSPWPKVDNICNNNCEVFNAKILTAREKPIITMLEEIRVMIFNTITTNKLKLARHYGHLPPIQQSRLEKLKKESNKWTATWSGDDDGHKFEVQCWPHRVAVNVGIQSCTCRFWELTGMPCEHAIAAISYKNERPEDHCHAWLTMASYQATYSNHIEALPGQEYWGHTDQTPLVPPTFKKRPGRPKKQRRKEGSETIVTPHKLKRKLKELTCSVCGQQNHNKQTCPVTKRQRQEQMQHAGSTDHPLGAGEGSAAGPPQLSASGPSEEIVIEPAEVSDTDLGEVGADVSGDTENLSTTNLFRPKLTITKVGSSSAIGLTQVAKDTTEPHKGSPHPNSPAPHTDAANTAVKFMPTPTIRDPRH